MKKTNMIKRVISAAVSSTENAEVGQLAKAKIVNGDIEYLYPYDLFDMHIKPYFRIIDMDKE